MYELKELKLTNIDDNYIFVNEKNEVIFRFDDLFMIDKEENMSDNVNIQVDEVSFNTYKVTLLPDSEWLKEAIYPVEIDPTIRSGSNNFIISSTHIKKQNPTINYSSSTTMPLASPGALELRGLLKFSMPSILINNSITYSYLTLTRSSATPGKQINIYKNTSNYTHSLVTWNSRPTYDSQVIDYHIIGENNKYRFDITSVLKDWHEAGISNIPGFTILDTEYSLGKNVLVQASGTNYPVLEIGYLDPGGIKDYWTYNSQSAGIAGTSYVCDFTGKLYFTRSDFNFSTSIQSLGLTFIYSNENRYVNFGYGNGWQTNYHIRIYQDTSINQSSFYTIDASGLKTYFIQTNTPNKFIAEDGSGNILTQETLGYIIKTKDNYEYYFDVNGYLYEIADLSKNREGLSENLSSIKIIRLSDKNKIDYVYDNSGNKIVFTYNSGMLDYTTLLIKQDDASFYTLERVNYLYTAYMADVVRHELNTVTYYKHYDVSNSLQLFNTINYTYDSYVRMVEASEANGVKLIYTYTDFKVAKIESFNKTYKFGELIYSYDFKRTTITNQFDEYIIYSFDDYGHTVNILDSDGTAQFFRYLNLYKTIEVGEVAGVEYDAIYTNYDGTPNYNNNHKLIEQSTPQNTTINPIVNHGFEHELNDVISWFVDIKSGNYFYCVFETSDITSLYGDKSGRINVTNGATASLYQSIKLYQGVHTISAYVKNNTNSDNVYISVAGVGVNNIDPIIHVDNDNDWHYVEIGFTVASDNTNVQIHLTNYSSGGSAYFDNIQLVTGYQETRKNMLENASFEKNGPNPGTLMSWYLSQNTSIYDISGENTGIYRRILGDQCIKLLGSADTREYALASLSQNLVTNTNKTLVVGGWAKSVGATSTTKKEIDRYFRINVSLFDASTSALVKQLYIDFDPSVKGWQYVCREILVDYQGELDIRLYLEHLGEGAVYFDSIQVYEEVFGTTYSYDAQGNVITVSNSSHEQTQMQYNSDNRLMVIIKKRADGTVINEVDLGYDINQPLMISEITYNNVKSNIDYTYTNNLLDTQTTTIGDTNTYFSFSTKYNINSGFGQYISKTSDEFGNETKYYYDTHTGLMKAIENAKLQDEHYIYDNLGRLVNVIRLEDYTTYNENDPEYDQAVEYRYDAFNRLWKIMIDDFYYEIIYDNQNRISQIKCNNTSLMSYTYVTKEGYYTFQIATQKYGNNDTIKYLYNDNNNIEFVQFAHSTTPTIFENKFSYEYDHLGRITTLNIWNKLANGENVIENAEHYTYGASNRLLRVSDNFGNVTKYDYDNQGNLVKLHFNINDKTHETNYLYSTTNSSTKQDFYDKTSYETKNGKVVTKEYNYEEGALYRLENIQLSVMNSLSINQAFTYEADTTRLYCVSYDVNDNLGDVVDYSYQYTYDELGNITEVKHYKNTLLVYQENYVYDALNQLSIEHIDFKGLPSYDSYTKRYTYDKHGNILIVEEYPLGTVDFTNTPQTKVINYEYNQSWKDQLASYGITEAGVSNTINFTYDEGGNPISITNFKYDGVVYDSALLDWNGRQLTSIRIIDDGLVVIIIAYKYNDLGYRISKSITKNSYAQQEVEIYNDGGISGTNIVPNTANLFDTYDEVTVYISAFGWHTFNNYGDLYIEDYDFLGDLFIEVFPSGVYIYAPYGVWKVTGSLQTTPSSTTTTTHYFLSNDKVIYETDGSYEIYYTYDYDGSIISFNYDSDINDSLAGEEYFYIKNQQGDITAIINSQGIIQVEYRYDARGNIIYINTPSGSSLDPNINPYTYRGYRYDSETGLYYCNSRYYNPQWGRWLNLDSINYLDPSSINGLNLYAYCGNNPVMGYDPNGTFFITIGVLSVVAKVVLAVVAASAVIGAVEAYKTASELGSTGWELAGYTASGVILGDYLPVKDNWDTISEGIVTGYNGTVIDFKFTENKYYNIYTAGLYADYLNTNCPVEGRTELGLFIELQAHYVAYKVGIKNGNPAMLGVPNSDNTALIAENIALIARMIAHRKVVMPNLLPREK